MNKLKKLLFIYSEIYFADNLLLGIVIIAVTFLDFNAGCCGLLSILSAYCFSRLTFLNQQTFESYYFYNPLLVGLSIGVLYKISLPIILLIIVSGILSIALTVTLGHLLKKYTELPILSIPFVIVSFIIYSAVSENSGVSSMYNIYHPFFSAFVMPKVFSGYFVSLGSIFFSQNVMAGILIAAALFVHSRIIFLLSIIGYGVGIFMASLFSSNLLLPCSELNYFNFILVAIAVGGIYLIPSFKSYLISTFAVTISYVILTSNESFFRVYGVPVFTLPFNVTVLCFIYYFDIINSKLRTRDYLKTPEENLDFSINYTRRFQSDYPSIFLPFSGEWMVSQSFNDELTHKGPWKFGVDFVLINDAGGQFNGVPNQAESFFAFSKPILSPVSGTVVTVVNDITDNEIGSVNRENNWGNAIVIYDPRGFYVKICHLKKDSVIPKPGMVVETGQLIAQCGNSGYSPYPHIHIQVQNKAENSASTLEFRFEQVLTPDGKYHNKLLPKKGQKISAMYSSIKKKKIFELLMKNSFEFSFSKKIREKKVFEKKEILNVVMDTDGTTFLENGKSRLYFETYRNVFRFYKYCGSKNSMLRYVYLAMPSLPLCENKIFWDDFLPLNVSLNNICKNFILLLQSVYQKISENRIQLSYDDNFRFKSSNSTLFFGKVIMQSDCLIKIDHKKFIEQMIILQKNSEIEINRISTLLSEEKEQLNLMRGQS